MLNRRTVNCIRFIDYSEVWRQYTTEGRTNRRTDGWIDGRINGQTNGRTDGRIGGSFVSGPSVAYVSMWFKCEQQIEKHSTRPR